MYPSLHIMIREVLKAHEEVKAQFILEPLAFTHINELSKTQGNAFLEQISYLTKTFAFYMHQEYKNILTILKDNPQVDTNTLLLSAQPKLSLCGDAHSHQQQHQALSQATPTSTRQDMSSQQTDHMLGLHAEYCQPGLQLCSSEFPVPSTSTTNFNNHAMASPTLVISCSDSHQTKDKDLVQDEHEPHHDHCVGVGCGGGVTAGLMSDSIPSCVVGQRGGRRGGGVGSVAAVCRPDSSAGASNQHSQLTSQNSADRLALSLARSKAL